MAPATLAEEQGSKRLIRLVNDLLLAWADAGRGLVEEPLVIQPVLEETARQAHGLDRGPGIAPDKQERMFDVEVAAPL